MKLWSVVLYEGTRLEAVVIDPAGKRRRVAYSWKSPDGVLPDNWYEGVVAEIKYQMGEELRGLHAGKGTVGP